MIPVPFVTYENGDMVICGAWNILWYTFLVQGSGMGFLPDRHAWQSAHIIYTLFHSNVSSLFLSVYAAFVSFIFI